MGDNNDTWYVDSAWSNRMTGDDSIFYNLDTSIKSQVKQRNGTLVEAQGKGKIAIQTNKGVKYINDIVLVPSLKHNLLSVGQMIKDGYSLHFCWWYLQIYNKDKRQIIVKVQM